MPDNANIENLNITVSASADKATSSLEKLSDGLEKAASATKELTQSTKENVSESKESSKATDEAKEKFEATAQTLRKFATAVSKMGLTHLGKQFNDLAKHVDLSQNLGKTTKAISDVSDKFAGMKGSGTVSAILGDIAEDPVAANKALEEAVKKQKEAAQAVKEQEKAAKEQAKAMEKAAKEAARIAEAQRKQAAKEDAAGLAAMKKQMEWEAGRWDRDKQADAAAAAKEEAAAKREAAKAAREQAKEEARLSKELEKQKTAVSKAKQAFKTFLGSIGRIAMYRAIRTAIKAVTSALKEGLTNLKTYSQEVGTAFAPAVDNLKQHIMLLKNSIATALRPVIEAVIPIVIQLADAFSRAADFIAQVMSVITGKVDDQGRYTKAVLGDLEESNKEAKELKRTLLGFDEINRLNGDTGSGESSAASTQFVQAEISEGASKFAEILKSIDWKMILDVAMAIAPIIAVIKAVGFAGNIAKIASKLKEVGAALGGFVTAHPVLTAILAVITAMAIWGDKIAEAMRDAKKAVDNFFSGIDKDGGSAAAALRLIRDLIGTVLDAIGTVSSMVFKLFHGDLIGAAQDGVHLLNVILQGVVKIVVGVINIILGLVEDVVNGVIAAARWIWNNALQPVFNAVAKWFKQAGVDIHNAWISIRIGINDAIIWILEKVNGLLGGIETVINGVIDLINWAFGEDIKPVKLQIDTSKLKDTKEELQNEKWPDIDQNIDLVGKWTETPEPLKLQLDASGLYDGMNEAEKNINAKLESLRKEAEKTKNTVASIGGSTGVVEKQALSPQKSFVQLYASGGYPSAGSMFIAGESGPELVASVGGTTGVWNSDQLIQGMYSAMSAALASNPSGGDIYLDGEVIYRNTVRRNNNAVRATGRSALLT